MRFLRVFFLGFLLSSASFAQSPKVGPRDREILRHGQISLGEQIGAGALAYLIGFGTGHAVLERYSELGWKFTVADGAGLLLFLTGYGDCASDNKECQRKTTSQIGAGLLFVSHVWQVVDVILLSQEHNQRHEQLTSRVDVGLGPTPDGAALVLNYRF